MLSVPNYYLTVNSVDDVSAATLNEFSLCQVMVLAKAPKNSFKIFILKCMVRSIQNSAQFSANQRPSLLEIGVPRYALMQWRDAYIYKGSTVSCKPDMQISVPWSTVVLARLLKGQQLSGLDTHG